MGNRANPPSPPPPPKWQQVIAPPAPPAEEKREVPEPQGVFVVPEDRMDDPRERSEPFARLPDHAKEELRDLWRGQEGVRGDQVVRRKETALRWVLEGAGLFYGAVWLFQTPSQLGLMIAGALGGAIGLGAARAKPAPLVYGLVFCTAYALFGAVSGSSSGFFAILSVPMVFGAAAALGVTHRIQRFDSTEL